MVTTADIHPIRAFRLAAGFSLRALGEASGVRYTRLWQIEQGLRASDRELQLIAVALGIPL
ncbi:MAG TPA: helix-turn-helix transcriptional regulator, partial [Vicinamibacterales bacterium]|nr:helix-turn-helix transcriptional regulator [Vicinamibacterales bacterium]